MGTGDHCHLWILRQISCLKYAVDLLSIKIYVYCMRVLEATDINLESRKRHLGKVLEILLSEHDKKLPRSKHEILLFFQELFLRSVHIFTV